MFGHSQPFEQSLQHEHVHLQLGQSLQQSFTQHVPVLQSCGLSTLDVGWLVVPATPAAISAAAMVMPPNSLTSMDNSLSWNKCGRSEPWFTDFRRIRLYGNERTEK